MPAGKNARLCRYEGASCGMNGARPNLKITNIPEANKYINKEYRKGWKF